jgi:Asp-tRNA(Asn)/Glu-tRNA(Gln) amidotransferase A subunit family amidase
MKKYLVLLGCLICFYRVSSQHLIDTAALSSVTPLFDLSFTAAEQDSMLDGVKEYAGFYKQLHALPISNELNYPFAFSPLPIGFKVPTKQEVLNWPIPANTVLPANRNELAYLSILELASLVKSKKISSVDLTTFFLDRLKKWGDTLECVITLTPELAMQQARQADEEIKNGKYRGPLHGIPYGLKDLFAVKGYKTTWGSVPYKDQVINQDAFVYTQLKNAGAVLCAKLTLGELAYNDLWFGGKTRNPWDISQGSSGSSAGSASATVAGLLPFTIGTETLGSIVSPSHTCGATGLRPTFGSVSRSGAMVLCWSLDKAGPICRSAEDAAVVFYYMKGTDGKDASAVERPFNYNGNFDIRKVRIGYASNFFKEYPKDAPEWKVIAAYSKLGAKVVPVNFPDSIMYPVGLISPILGAESAAAFDELTRGKGDDLIRRQDKDFWPNSFRVSRLIPAVEYINANRHRAQLIERMHTFISDYDVLIVPTFAGRQLSITNLTGHPVVVFPIRFNEKGLPESITLIGNLFDEATILAAAKAYQDATDFNKKHPAKFLN